MKQTALIIAVLVLAGAGLFYMFTGKSVQTVEKITQQEELPITLYKESGFVTWKKKGDADYTRVDQDEIALPNNVYVKTADDGLGYVVLPDNSTISLDKNTEILISYTPTKTSIQQLLGSTYHRVEALVSGKEYEVRTPGTLAAVRGTKFAVSYDKKRRKTNVTVTEHKVAVAPIDTIDAVATSTPKTIDAGNTASLEDAPEATTTEAGASVKPRGGIVIQKTDKIPEEKKWVDQNVDLDKELDTKKEKKEFIKEFIKKMKDEEKKKEETQLPKSTDETKERITTVKKVIKEIKVEHPELDNIKPKTEEENKTPKTETKTPETDTSSSGTSGAPATGVTKPTLKIFDTTTELLSPEDEKFTNDFYTLYEKYLYVDANAGVCSTVKDLSGTAIVATLERFSNGAGYVLPKKDLILSLANDIVAACTDGSAVSKSATFQSRFDVAYPFSQ